MRRGAYVLAEPEGGPPEIVLAGSGSEVQHCVAAAATLATDGVRARVVSFPSWDRFEAQPDDYRASVFPAGVPVLSIEAGSTFGWDRYADDAIGIDHFGASAPGRRSRWRSSGSRRTTWSSGPEPSWRVRGG